MTLDEWRKIDLYVPEREDSTAAKWDVMFHEMLLSLADVSEQALAAQHNQKNKARLLSLADACDQLAAAAMDMLYVLADKEDHGEAKKLVEEENARTEKRFGAPSEREDELTDFVRVIAEEVGEVAEAGQIWWFEPAVFNELVQVASAAITLRRIALHRSGIGK
jgi:hypothetical protein